MSGALPRLSFCKVWGTNSRESLETSKRCNNEMVKFKVGIAKVQGYSMVPTLVPNDRVIVRYGNAFSVGDVIVFTRDDHAEIKRVERIEDGGLFLV